MNKTAQNILDTLPIVLQNYKTLKERKSTHTYLEISINEAFTIFSDNYDLLATTIKNELFNTISLNKQATILDIINEIKNQLDDIKKNGFQPSFIGPNTINKLIKLTIDLTNILEDSMLLAKSLGIENYTNKTINKEIQKTYSKIITNEKDIISILEEIKQTKSDTQNIYDTTKSLYKEADEKLKELTNIKQETAKILNVINETREKTKSSEQEIENKKLKINTFASNIDEYESRIEQYIKQAKEILELETTIQNIISKAEMALNLNSAQGISAAFSAQYDTAKNANIILKTNSWIFGAFLFIVVALVFTFWIAFDASMITINSIIARITAVTVSITGAAFCAAQYTKQKNIAEDYAYKAVLAKSIIAFTDEIKKKDEKLVAEYIMKVLDEIHKDPLRTKNNQDNTNFILDKLNELIKNLPNKIAIKE
ncbi:MAG: hypothetical protein LBI78_02420 [Campylobacteraceae bacterium]|jgi:hypothetical protein|nr:hypothetical protein [Campylobacteraceae bacterium]